MIALTKRKLQLEAEEGKRSKAEKKKARVETAAGARQMAAREGATRLWTNRLLGVEKAVHSLNKPHMAALLILTQTENIKGNESNTILQAALLQKLVGVGASSNGVCNPKLKHLVSLFIDTDTPAPLAVVDTGAHASHKQDLHAI